MKLTLYSKPGCHLCEVMKGVIQRVASRVPIELDEVDILGDPDLNARYGLDVPVLTAGDRTLAKHRISEEELLRLLDREGHGSTVQVRGSGGRIGDAGP